METPTLAHIRLARNVQFIYEYALASLELTAGFSADSPRFEPSDPWCMDVNVNGSTDAIRARSAYASLVDGVPTVYGQLITPGYQGGVYNQTRSANQFLTHWIYPYKGKFHPQMVRAILNIIRAKPGDVVLDPFVGSGTTALECQLLGIDCVAVDASPLCVLLTRVKTHSCNHLTAIRAAVDDIQKSGLRHPDDLDPSQFSPQAVADFLQIARMVTYSDIANRGRDPAVYLPRNLSRMLCSVEAMVRAIGDLGLKLGTIDARLGDARDLSSLSVPSASIDAVVTSPPYSIALDYVKNDAHALTAMGLDLKRLRDGFVGVRGRGQHDRMAKYSEDIKAAFGEIARVLKPHGQAAVVIGNATTGGTETTTTEDMKQWAAERGLRLEREMPKIVWGLYNVVDDEKILFFRRS